MINIALAGNPNVGKSTIFNKLTKLKQHTGNWTGKTVDLAVGKFTYKNKKYTITDIPGTYSLLSNSEEEEIARDFICFKNPDITVIVCDASCIERNINLVIQTLEVTNNAILCLNLIDEAKKKKININIPLLEQRIKIPVIPMTATKNKGFNALLGKIEDMALNGNNNVYKLNIEYDYITENAIKIIFDEINKYNFNGLNKRWLSVRLLENGEEFIKTLKDNIKLNEYELLSIKNGIEMSNKYISENNINISEIKDRISKGIIKISNSIINGVISIKKDAYSINDRRIDNILTGKFTAFPIMTLLLLLILWITITGANYPSAMLSNIFFSIEDNIYSILNNTLNFPTIICDMLIYGVYRVLAWVVSVMLPPMAIFFPMFTLLEDLGYLPRIAFNIDNCFRKNNACGKQALCMAMGFGCNAAGVTGCRIISSPREKLIAIITNSFIPCNGRFPTLIAIISMFFAFNIGFSSIITAIILCLIIALGIFMTLIVSKILGNTILKGIPSSVALEMPSYRKPQITSVIIRSVFDRTLFLLGRAVIVSAPAGLIIWVMTNTFIGDYSILDTICNFLNPFASLFGLDGVILMAFILGFPANEIVIPIMVMAYMGSSSLTDMENIFSLKQLLVANGWSIQTALSVIIFSLMHWPCSTTCLTIKKETKSIKWTLLSIAIPTICGFLICGIINIIFNIFGNI